VVPGLPLRHNMTDQSVRSEIIVSTAAETHSENRRRRNPEERPQQILAAALEEFGESGLAGARLEDIAQRAGVAKGTIYLYFPTKEALFREVIRSTVVVKIEGAERELAALDTDPSAPSAEATLREFMRNWWDTLCSTRYERMHRLVVGELHRFPDLVSFYSDEVVLRGRRLVAALIQRGIDRGEFRAVDAAVAARITTSSIMTHAASICPTGVMNDLHHVPNEIIFEQVMDFVLKSLRPDTSRAAR
jgi:AcrR family transcriptional regulator